MKDNAAQIAVSAIQKIAKDFRPRVAVVLGSGLGRLADELQDAIAIDYADIPGFPKGSVKGHGGKLVLGYCNGVAVACLQGRAHTYEGLENYETVKTYVRAMKLLGAEYFLATNASGSLREEVGPGELMLISDHINLQPSNPLIGENDENFGPRFYPLDEAYHPSIRTELKRLATEKNIRLHEGVYISVLGPHYETAAEIRAFKIWGADAVGMSTVPEVLVANHCGMKVGVIAIITNHATGLSKTAHSHDAVVAQAEIAALNLNALLQAYIAGLK